MNQKMIKLKCHVNDKGSLISLESGKNIPFDIKRVYYIFGVKDEVRRGFHAHKSLDQVLVCTSGSCKVLTDDGRNKENYELNSLSWVFILELCFGTRCSIFSRLCLDGSCQRFL